MEDNAQAQNNKKIPPIYLVQTALKAAFIVMSIFNMNYTISVGLLASVCGLLRMLKTPQFNKQYLQRVLRNNHGQNVLFLGMGCVGTTNFLFFAPIILYFFFGLAQFYNQIIPAGSGSPKLRSFVDQIRNNRFYFMETKSRLQIIYFVYLLVTIPLDLTRILKCLLIAQFNMLRFQISVETQHAAKNVNAFILNKISGIGFLHKIYTKIIDKIYQIATRNPNQQ